MSETVPDGPWVEDFIGYFPNAIPDNICDELIERFDLAEELGFTISRKQENGTPANFKQDAICYCYTLPIGVLTKANTVQEFNGRMWGCYEAYAERFEAALTQASDPHQSYMVKIQKTLPGQGYHVWHYESSTRETGTRLLTWIAYLNDIEDGGETEFLYLGRRIKPEKGSLIIWPAAFTHTHRGNPPLKETKYIATGWIEF